MGFRPIRFLVEAFDRTKLRDRLFGDIDSAFNRGDLRFAERQTRELLNEFYNDELIVEPVVAVIDRFVKLEKLEIAAMLARAAYDDLSSKDRAKEIRLMVVESHKDPVEKANAWRYIVWTTNEDDLLHNTAVIGWSATIASIEDHKKAIEACALSVSDDEDPSVRDAAFDFMKERIKKLTLCDKATFYHRAVLLTEEGGHREGAFIADWVDTLTAIKDPAVVIQCCQDAHEENTGDNKSALLNKTLFLLMLPTATLLKTTERRIEAYEYIAGHSGKGSREEMAAMELWGKDIIRLVAKQVVDADLFDGTVKTAFHYQYRHKPYLMDLAIAKAVPHIESLTDVYARISLYDLALRHVEQGSDAETGLLNKWAKDVKSLKDITQAVNICKKMYTKYHAEGKQRSWAYRSMALICLHGTHAKNIKNPKKRADIYKHVAYFARELGVLDLEEAAVRNWKKTVVLIEGAYDRANDCRYAALDTQKGSLMEGEAVKAWGEVVESSFDTAAQRIAACKEALESVAHHNKHYGVFDKAVRKKLKALERDLPYEQQMSPSRFLDRFKSGPR